MFSADSRSMAYVAQTGTQWFVVVDGKEGKRYDGIATLEGANAVSGSFDSLYCSCIQDNGIYLVEVRTAPIVQNSPYGQLGSIEQ